MQLFVTGARQAGTGDQDLAVALILDTESGEILHECHYEPEPELFTEGQGIHFTGHCFANGYWCVCTFNEVLLYDTWPPTEPVKKFADRGFNDLHHCFPWEGNLAVSNTGLETVDIIDFEGTLLERFDLIKDETGPDKERLRPIDPEVDYRLIDDTKPHIRHGNHLFEFGGKLWTSQLRAANAVCVTDPTRTLEMEVGQPHDGTRFDDVYAFTTTNSHVVLFGAEPPHTRTIYNLVEITEGLNQLGWCRGVARVPGERDQYLVGFSLLRRSKWKEFGYWVKHGHEAPPARVGLYDLKEGTLKKFWGLGKYKAFQLFQLDVLPPERCV